MALFVKLVISDQSDTDNHRVMQEFGTSAFDTVTRWHKLCEMDNKCTLHNFIVLAICVLKIIKFGGDLTKFWQS